MRTILAVLFEMGACVSVLAQAVPEYVHIDFSHLPDGTPTTEAMEIGDQFSAYGIWFSMDDGPGLPIVAKQGSPAVAYLSSTNDYICFGTFGLTDPIGPGNDIIAFRPLRIDFDPPARLFRLSCGHSMGTAFPDVKFYYGDSVQQIVTSICPGPQASPNGGCQRYEAVSANNPGGSLITHVVLSNPNAGSLGYTVSALTVVREPQAIGGQVVRVAQESVPGKGDFEENILGVLRPWRAPSAGAPLITDVYPYGEINWNDVSYDGPQEVLGLMANGTRLAFFEAKEGLSMVVVHDQPRQQCPDGFTNGGGHAEMRLLFDGLMSPLSITVKDDLPVTAATPDEYTLDSNYISFTAVNDWDSPNTDGFAISGFSGNWTTILSFTEVDGLPSPPPIAGLDAWAAITSDGPPIALTLQADLRVQFKAICLADVNNNCRVDLTDLKSFADCMHGPDQSISEGCEVFDIDAEHDVDLWDFARFEAAFSGS